MNRGGIMTSDSNMEQASAWKTLYRIGGGAALIAVILFRRNLSAEISLFRTEATPVRADEWFALLQDDRLVGLGMLNLGDVFNYALLGLMLLALYIVLRRFNESAMKIALSLGMVGAAVSFASNQAFSMLALSDRYAAATADAQRTIFLAAGEALLAAGQGTGFYMSLLLVTLACLITSIVMLNSDIFSKGTAYLGILANVLVLGYFVTVAFAPTLTFLPHTLAAIPLILWELLIGHKLFQLARGIPE
jgi:hypothetical protein